MGFPLDAQSDVQRCSSKNRMAATFPGFRGVLGQLIKIITSIVYKLYGYRRWRRRAKWLADSPTPLLMIVAEHDQSRRPNLL
jgi:hypothetical protein